MIPLEQLIALYRQHILDYGAEIDVAVARYNARTASGNIDQQDEDIHRICETWRQAQREARDTVSYLEALQRRMFVSGGRVSE